MPREASDGLPAFVSAILSSEKRAVACQPCLEEAQLEKRWFGTLLGHLLVLVPRGISFTVRCSWSTVRERERRKEFLELKKTLGHPVSVLVCPLKAEPCKGLYYPWKDRLEPATKTAWV